MAAVRGPRPRATESPRAGSRNSGQPFSAPALVLMMRPRKTKNRTATGTAMMAAAASLSGYWFSRPSWPDASCAAPSVSVTSPAQPVAQRSLFVGLELTDPCRQPRHLLRGALTAGRWASFDSRAWLGVSLLACRGGAGVEARIARIKVNCGRWS